MSRSRSKKAAQPLFVMQALPPTLSRHILLLLPADARVRAGCVCVPWYILVRSPALALWREVDLTEDASVRGIYNPSKMLNSISRLALKDSGVRQRDVGILRLTTPVVDMDALKELVRVHKSTLTNLCVKANVWLSNALEPRVVFSLLRISPRLIVETPVSCTLDEASALREDKKLSKNLRVTGLICSDVLSETDAGDAVRDLQQHPLRSLAIGGCDGGAVAPLIRAAVEPLRLTSLCLQGCYVESVLEPLTYVLRDGSLRILGLYKQFFMIPPGIPNDVPIAAFCSALAASLTLRTLALSDIGLFLTAGGVSVLRAAASCVGLEELSIHRNPVSCLAASPCCAAAVGAVLGGMVSGQFGCMSLTTLDVADCSLTDVGLTPLVSALPGNTKLCTLSLGKLTKEFHSDKLFPAIQANESLMRLDAGGAEAELFVAQRRRARVYLLGSWRGKKRDSLGCSASCKQIDKRCICSSCKHPASSLLVLPSLSFSSCCLSLSPSLSVRGG